MYFFYIATRLKEAEEMLQKMSATHENNWVVTTQGSVIHFAMASLPETDTVYQFFFEVFLAGLFSISFKKIACCITHVLNAPRKHLIKLL